MLNRLWNWLRALVLLRRSRRGSGIEAQRARQALSGLMGESRGLLLKVGQIQTLLRIGRDTAGQVSPEAEGWSLERILPFLRQELGDEMLRLKELSESVAAASLGQIHRALLDGHRPVAVKVQYPDMRKAVTSELRWAGLLPGVGPIRRWGFDLDQYRQGLADMLGRELDYRCEAETQERMRKRLEPLGIAVPRVVPELSGERVLVQSWHEGLGFHELDRLRSGQRVLVGRQLLVLFLHSLFVSGELHADPNPGNYLVKLCPRGGPPSLSLLDFGCVVHIAEEERLTFLTLAEAARTDDLHDVLGLWQRLGFDGESLAVLGRDDLAALTRLIFRPFVGDGLFDPAEWNLSASVDELLDDRKWLFRAAAPARVLWIVRALHGLTVHLQSLGARLPWYPLLEGLVLPESWDAARALLEEQRGRSPSVGERATTLRVRISSGDREDFGIALPARDALDLPSVVPPEVANRLGDHGVRLDDVSRRLRRDGLSAQSLFQLDDGIRAVAVWLE